MSVVPRSVDVISACAHEVSGRLEDVAETLAEQLGRSLPELTEDEDVARVTVASTRGNVEAMLSVFRGETTAEQVQLPGEVTSFALTLARRRLTMQHLLQSYRVGQALFARLWMDALAARIDDQAVFLEALHESNDELNVYLDRVVQHVVSAFESERDRWLRGTAARRADLVERLLRGERTGLDAASAQLGHELRGPQTGLVAWVGEHGDVEAQLTQLETCVAALGRAVGTPRIFTMPMGTSAVWAWIAGDVVHEHLAAAAADLPHPDVLLATGDTEHGPEGFRRSHHQAVRARRVASRMVAPDRLTRFADVVTVALLAGDDDAAREFVARALGDLAGRDAATARLRETLWVLLQEGGNTRRASERLFTHRNTVLYRLQRAEALLGHPLEAKRLQVEFALLLTVTFGERVLPDPGRAA